MKRERLGSRIGFIFLSAGCAIGCGNVWKFPWLTGQNGGGGFVLIYLLCLLVLGLPVMTMEFSLGRAAQTSPLGMYRKLQKPGHKWGSFGYLAFIGNVCLMAFYAVVTGWMIYYFCKFVVGSYQDMSFYILITKPIVNVSFMAVGIIVAFTILSFNLQGGLERITKYTMGALFVLLIVLAIRSTTLPGAKEGLSFYLLPDISKINGNVIVAAMNQAFFTLSLGIGSMAIFGSYLDKDRSLMGESINVISLDLLVAIMAGIIIFPACFTYDMEVNAGPALLFDTMAAVFVHMENGRIWGSLFFLFMIFAAFSTELAVFENILACVREFTGWSRPKGCIVCGISIFLLALTTALGFSVWKFQPFAEGTSWMDLWDFIVNNNLLPLGSVVVSLFCCTKLGWGWDNFLAEANAGKGMKVQPWMKPVFKYVVPVVVLFLYFYGLATFSWR